MSLKITEREIDGVTILTLDGRVVFGDESMALRDKVQHVVDAGNKKLVLNVSNVSFVDSAGLGALVSAHHATSSKGGTLRLCNLGAKLKDLLKMTKMYTVFQVSETEMEAIQTLTQ